MKNEISTMLTLNGVPVTVAESIAALQNDSNTTINDNCTAIAKIVLSNYAGKGYAKLYREKRNGAKYLNGYTICFFGACSNAHTLINTIFDVLSINAVAVTTAPVTNINGHKLRITQAI